MISCFISQWRKHMPSARAQRPSMCACPPWPCPRLAKLTPWRSGSTALSLWPLTLRSTSCLLQVLSRCTRAPASKLGTRTAMAQTPASTPTWPRSSHCWLLRMSAEADTFNRRHRSSTLGASWWTGTAPSTSATTATNASAR